MGAVRSVYLILLHLIILVVLGEVKIFTECRCHMINPPILYLVRHGFD
jgi:hypothetical protein